MMNHDDGTAAAQAAATWIIDQVNKFNYLDHADAVAYLRRWYGNMLVATDAKGRTVLGPAIRAAVRVQGQGLIVWEAALWRWRRREQYDAAWRRAA